MKTIEQAAIDFFNEYGYNESSLERIAFEDGAAFAQRWIPVEEEWPPIDIDVVLKYRYFDRPLYWVGTINTIERLKHFLNKHLLFTHWRPIEYP